MVTGMFKLWAWGVVFYLEKEVRGVMHQHHQSANSHIVGTVGETNKEYGGNVMNYLLLEILEDTDHTAWEERTWRQQLLICGTWQADLQICCLR